MTIPNAVQHFFSNIYHREIVVLKEEDKTIYTCTSGGVRLITDHQRCLHIDIPPSTPIPTTLKNEIDVLCILIGRTKEFDALCIDLSFPNGGIFLDRLHSQAFTSVYRNTKAHAWVWLNKDKPPQSPFG